MRLLRTSVLLNVAFFVSADLAQASACCGGSFSLPAFILTDESAQLTATYLVAQPVSDVLASGKWVRRTDDEVQQTLRLDSAFSISERCQVNLSAQTSRRSRIVNGASQNGMNFGDTTLSAAYEPWFEDGESLLRPKTLFFTQLLLPTGRSIYEVQDPLALDVAGQGHFNLGAGAVFMKVFAPRWDIFLSPEIHRGLPRTFATAEGELRTQPGFGGSLSLGGGWNYSDYRVGATLTSVYEDGIETEGRIATQPTPQRYTSLALSLGWLITPDWTTSINYADQSLLGAPLTTVLNRSVGLTLQYRALR
jgi:hypothetical protein